MIFSVYFQNPTNQRNFFDRFVKSIVKWRCLRAATCYFSLVLFIDGFLHLSYYLWRYSSSSCTSIVFYSFPFHAAIPLLTSFFSNTVIYMRKGWFCSGFKSILILKPCVLACEASFLKTLIYIVLAVTYRFSSSKAFQIFIISILF